MNWEQISLIVGILSPLVGAPLVMITLYLRAIREHQASGMAEVTHRIQTLESALHELVKSTSLMDREYTTKEEWVRESMFGRQRLDKLTELVTRIQVELESGHGVASEIGRLATAITQLMGRLQQESAGGTAVCSEGPRGE